jgi:hypothetical protein
MVTSWPAEYRPVPRLCAVTRPLRRGFVVWVSTRLPSSPSVRTTWTATRPSRPTRLGSRALIVRQPECRPDEPSARTRQRYHWVAPVRLGTMIVALAAGVVLVVALPAEFPDITVRSTSYPLGAAPPVDGSQDRFTLIEVGVPAALGPATTEEVAVAAAGVPGAGGVTVAPDEECAAEDAGWEDAGWEDAGWEDVRWDDPGCEVWVDGEVDVDGLASGDPEVRGVVWDEVTPEAAPDGPLPPSRTV